MPDIPGPIKSIKKSSESVYKEKSSVFKAEAFPIMDEDAVSTILKDIRKKYYDAAHHCYGWRLKNNSFKYSDDGEPGGTAGIRILNAIDHFNLTDIICVVTRWFGGTKLGVGPLGKAYYTAAENALTSAEILTRYPFRNYSLQVPYQYSSQFFHILDKYRIKIAGTTYKEYPEYESFFPLEHENDIISELLESSLNNIKIKLKGNISFL